AVTEVGLSDAVAPEGCPVTDRDTVPAEPEVTAVEMVLVPEFPCTRLRLVGLAEIEKSLAGGPETLPAEKWSTAQPLPLSQDRTRSEERGVGPAWRASGAAEPAVTGVGLNGAVAA